MEQLQRIETAFSRIGTDDSAAQRDPSLDALRQEMEALDRRQVDLDARMADQQKIDVAKAAGYSDPFAGDANLIYDTAASLWKAGYRSLDGYLSAARQEMILRNGTISDALGIHFKRASRAAARGRGPPRQSSELPFERLRWVE